MAIGRGPGHHPVSLTGDAMAQPEAPSPAINPTAEHAYWESRFRAEPYYKPDLTYRDYSPAYRVGYTGPLRRRGSFTALETELKGDWDRVKGSSRLTWAEAREATRAAWERVAYQQPS
jgi:hypothetical protein